MKAIQPWLWQPPSSQGSEHCRHTRLVGNRLGQTPKAASVSQTSDGSSDYRRCPGLCHGPSQTSDGRSLTNAGAMGCVMACLPRLMRCFSPDRIPGVSMMLMLSRTGFGSWAHMNLRKSQSQKREVIAAFCAPLPPCFLPMNSGFQSS